MLLMDVTDADRLRALMTLIQTGGTILAAIIAASIAVHVVGKQQEAQRKNEREKERIQEIKHVLKCCDQIYLSLTRTQEYFSRLHESITFRINFENQLSVENIHETKRQVHFLKENIIQTYKWFEQIEEEHLPPGDFFRYYLTIKVQLESMINILEINLNGIIEEREKAVLVIQVIDSHQKAFRFSFLALVDEAQLLYEEAVELKSIYTKTKPISLSIDRNDPFGMNSNFEGRSI
ncbi:hypothetical protein [Saccharibacillus brassicae]|uniref:Uncharacterized protein n=1 Tax=Saccharibacillus brassicae TaxID=2583377 RepID=A0A4Y6V3N2_SACBS|nr:hypothetical protein [Saccharibacillus brassicae]QDH23468.1 hypothetical protein FFV09_22945 [Saccharibacillus brassicae]